MLGRWVFHAMLLWQPLQPSPSKAQRETAFTPHSQEEPGAGRESSFGCTAMMCISVTLFSAPGAEGWEAGESGVSGQSRASEQESFVLSPLSPQALLALTFGQGRPRPSQLKPWGLGLFSARREGGTPHRPSKPPGCGNKEEGGHFCHLPSAPIRHYSLGILPPPSAR